MQIGLLRGLIQNNFPTSIPTPITWQPSPPCIPVKTDISCCMYKKCLRISKIKAKKIIDDDKARVFLVCMRQAIFAACEQVLRLQVSQEFLADFSACSIFHHQLFLQRKTLDTTTINPRHYTLSSVWDFLASIGLNPRCLFTGGRNECVTKVFSLIACAFYIP